MLNNGDGTFAHHITYAAGDGTVSIGIDDVDGDLDPDLVAANFFGGSASVY